MPLSSVKTPLFIRLSMEVFTLNFCLFFFLRGPIPTFSETSENLFGVACSPPNHVTMFLWPLGRFLFPSSHLLYAVLSRVLFLPVPTCPLFLGYLAAPFCAFFLNLLCPRRERVVATLVDELDRASQALLAVSVFTPPPPEQSQAFRFFSFVSGTPDYLPLTLLPLRNGRRLM